MTTKMMKPVKNLVGLFIGLVFLTSCQEGRQQVAQAPAQVSTTLERAKDSLAIMEAIALESRNFYLKDHKAWAASYVHSPKVHWICVEPGISLRANGWDDLSKFVADWMVANPKPMELKQSNSAHSTVEMEIFPEMAFVTIEASNLNEDGKTTRYTMGSRTMVKQNGEWKILSMTSYPNDSPSGSTPNVYKHSAE
jgi:hypothetical protein